jgi:hypothetical protein
MQVFWMLIRIGSLVANMKAKAANDKGEKWTRDIGYQAD